jgi:hypothetical protein
LAELNGADPIDWERALIDAAFAKAPAGGADTGPNPTDRSKSGSKHHVLTDAQEIPLAATVTAANVNEVTQVHYELWVVATRPAAINGLGLTITKADTQLTRLQTLFPLFPDIPAIFPEWKPLVTAHQATGQNAHDARLVAAMSTHGITHIFNINTEDFARYPGVTVLDPQTVAVSSSS